MQELLFVLGVRLSGHPCLKPVPSLMLYQGTFSIDISFLLYLVLPHPSLSPSSSSPPLFLSLLLPPPPHFIFSYYKDSPLSCSYLCLQMFTAAISGWDPTSSHVSLHQETVRHALGALTSSSAPASLELERRALVSVEGGSQRHHLRISLRLVLCLQHLLVLNLEWSLL